MVCFVKKKRLILPFVLETLKTLELLFGVFAIVFLKLILSMPYVTFVFSSVDNLGFGFKLFSIFTGESDTGSFVDVDNGSLVFSAESFKPVGFFCFRLFLKLKFKAQGVNFLWLLSSLNTIV
jgi:hypothetical protein